MEELHPYANNVSQTCGSSNHHASLRIYDIYIYSNTERMSIRLVTVPLTIEEKKTTKKVEIYNPSGGFRALENAITILIH